MYNHIELLQYISASNSAHISYLDAALHIDSRGQRRENCENVKEHLNTACSVNICMYALARSWTTYYQSPWHTS